MARIWGLNIFVIFGSSVLAAGCFPEPNDAAFVDTTDSPNDGSDTTAQETDGTGEPTSSDPGTTATDDPASTDDPTDTSVTSVTTDGTGTIETDTPTESDSGFDSNTQDQLSCDDNPCDENATCDDSGEEIVCECREGFDGDGKTCEDIDECAGGTDNCDANATCTNTIGSFSCFCNDGYEGDGVTCVDSGVDTVDTDSDEGEVPEPGEGEFRVSGTVTRTAKLSDGGDGIGTLCLTVLKGCPSMTNQNPEAVGNAGIEVFDADLSSTDTALPFHIIATMADFEDGVKYAVSGSLRENGEPCVDENGEDMPIKGDSVTFDMGADPCGSFEYSGESVDGVDVTLNMAMPF